MAVNPEAASEPAVRPRRAGRFLTLLAGLILVGAAGGVAWLHKTHMLEDLAEQPPAIIVQLPDQETAPAGEQAAGTQPAGIAPAPAEPSGEASVASEVPATTETPPTVAAEAPSAPEAPSAATAETPPAIQAPSTTTEMPSTVTTETPSAAEAPATATTEMPSTAPAGETTATAEPTVESGTPPPAPAEPATTPPTSSETPSAPAEAPAVTAASEAPVAESAPAGETAAPATPPAATPPPAAAEPEVAAETAVATAAIPLPRLKPPPPAAPAPALSAPVEPAPEATAPAEPPAPGTSLGAAATTEAVTTPATTQTAVATPPAPASTEPPWKRFARAFPADETRPRVSVVITGLGLTAAQTQAAIDQLPPEITLAFTPYSGELQDWIAKARAAGHEVLLEVPMEPINYPADDPGPQALLASLSPAENLKRLEWVLARSDVIAGVLADMGSRFQANARLIRPVLTRLAEKGYLYIDNRSGPTSVVGEIAAGIDLPWTYNTRFIDAEATRVSIDGRLQQLERTAREKGFALGLAQGYPVTIERVAAWARSLEVKGLALAPASALVKTGAQ